jgi:hypothetical protein
MKRASGFGRMILAVILVALFGAYLPGQEKEADNDEPVLVFQTDRVPGGPDQYNGAWELRRFTALLKDGKRVAGRPLGSNAIARSVAADKYKDEDNIWVNSARQLPAGANDSAVEYPVDGAFGLASATVAIEVRGRGWSAASGFEETLITFEKGGETLAVLTDGTGNLALRSSGGTVSAKVDALDGIHTIIAAFENGQGTLYLDALPIARGSVAGMPAVETVTVGQIGKGPGEDKDIIAVEIHDRPFIQAEVSKWHLDVGLQPPAHLTLVERRNPIAIDGAINSDEWADAARITGLVKVGSDGQYTIGGPATLASDQSIFYLTYDNEKLYVAHYSPPPERIKDQPQLIVAMLKRTMDKHDDALVMDDNIKLTFMDGYPQGEEKKIYINGQGTTYEFLPLKWDPKMEVKSRLTNTGWYVEASIAWEDLHVGMPEPGKTVRMNMLRGWKQEMDENHIWTFGIYDRESGRKAEERGGPNPAGAVTLAGDQGIVVRLDEVGPLNRGILDIKATIVNLTKDTQNLTARLDSNSGAIKGEESIALASGGRKQVSFTHSITDFVTHTVTLTVTDPAGREYFAQGWPVRRRYKPEIYIRKYRSRDLIAFENNFEFLSEFPLKNIKAELTITSRKTGRKVYEDDFMLPAYTTRDEVSTRDWETGSYDVEYRFKVGLFRTIGRATTVYEHVPLPPWWDNTLGYDVENFAPYPWTPMALNGTTVDCWGRRYHYGESLLPHQVETQGRPLLRAPITLAAKTADGEVLSSATAKVTKAEWTKKLANRIEGTRVIESEGFSMRNDFWTEYDGFTWCSITIEPKKKVMLDELTLEIPLTPEFSDVMNSYDYGLTNTMEVHPFTGSNLPIWVGNGDGGIQWMAETDGAFFVENLKEITHVIPGEKGTSIKIVMIDVPTDFEKPHTIEFGINATPTRKKLLHTSEDPFYWGLFGSVGGYWYPKGQEFRAAPDYGYGRAWKPNSNSLTRYSWLTRIYVTVGSVNVNFGNDRDFADEWLSSPGTRVEGVVTCTQASKLFRDYFVWRHWNYIHNVYPAQSLYYDTANEVGSSNEYAGAGYVRRDGTRVGQKGILGAREVCKRMYNTMVRWYPFAWIGHHTSGMLNTAYIQYGTHLIDGENFNSIIGPGQPTYVGALTPERFRAQYMGYNFSGQPSLFMGQGRMGFDEAEMMGGADNLMDHVHGLFLLHDDEPMGWMFGKNQSGVLEGAGKRCWDAVEKNNLFSPFYEFVPYWHQKAVETPFEDFYASFYRFRHAEIDKLPMGGFSIFSDMTDEQKKNYRKVVCIFYNHSDFEGQIKLKVDWKALGLDSPEGLTAENAVHKRGFRVETVKDENGKETLKGVFYPKPEETAEIIGDELVFPMTPWNYRMIVLERKD